MPNCIVYPASGFGLLLNKEESSKQNVETKVKVIDENDGLRVAKRLAEQEASRNSQEEPPLKKKKSEEKNCNQNDEAKEPMSDYWREFRTKYYGRDIGGIPFVDFMSPKPIFLKRFRPGLKM
ncbi:hypothetical protein MKX03_000818 [Papaver bracteatum]|nr:hypothetical protein MKX03_000818 [Papaver bracteatum]